MTKDVIKRYTNGEVTVIWQPSLCVHSAICFRGLPAVFNPRRRPWVVLDGHTTDAIIAAGRGLPVGRPLVRAEGESRAV